MHPNVEKLPDEPIIIVTVTESSDVESVAAACDAIIGDKLGPFYRINDFSAFSFTFSGLMVGMAAETTRLPGSLSDPRIKPVFVGTSDMVKLGSQAGRQEQYGELAILLFATLEDALQHIRLQLQDV
ncbi:MAG: hypothetical protein GYB68_16500 [Chloroflexi bacterium]|nr:hypothetical protein [Chloroflexota bacterium]